MTLPIIELAPRLVVLAPHAEVLPNLEVHCSMRTALTRLIVGLLFVPVSGPLASARPRPQLTEKLNQLSASKPAQVRESPKDGLKYVWIPPGTFQMGCSPEDEDCFDEEKPSHEVRISKGFWMGQTEVTVGHTNVSHEPCGNRCHPSLTCLEGC
jgi:formylglycine-generating enzyme required for sulfatase activity